MRASVRRPLAAINPRRTGGLEAPEVGFRMRDASATDLFASYDGFLKTAIERHWSGGRSRAHFVALLLASREAWEVAWEGVATPGAGQKALVGAGGVAAVYVALRLLVGGPIGLVLTGVSVASLVSVYAQHHRRIWEQQARYRRLIGDYRVKYDRIRGEYLEGTCSEEQRDLMLEGLLGRFLDDIDEDPGSPEADDERGGEFGPIPRRKDGRGGPRAR